jgi:4-carboxymuconolactone decarboxylase
MTAEQREIYRDILLRGGRLGGPYEAYIHDPGFMRLNQAMGDQIRATSLNALVRHVVVLTTVNHWGAGFAWAMNAAAARRDGLSDRVIEAIGLRRRPAVDHAQDLAWEYTRELLASQRVPDRLHAEAIGTFGTTGLVHIVCTIGFFTMACITLTAFEIPPPRT